MTITMNRPERLNAWTYQMGAELQHAIEHGNDDANVDVFVLTGAGRGFCAGADIKDLFKNQADAGDDGSNERPARDWVGLVRGGQADDCCSQRRRCWCGADANSALRLHHGQP